MLGKTLRDKAKGLPASPENRESPLSNPIPFILCGNEKLVFIIHYSNTPNFPVSREAYYSNNQAERHLYFRK